MPHTLIQQNPNFTKKVEGENKLAIAEMFCDTLQGEGVSTGVLSTFIRLQGCTLKCVWCDTLEVWPNGNEYSFEEIFKLFESLTHCLFELSTSVSSRSPYQSRMALEQFRFWNIPVVTAEMWLYHEIGDSSDPRFPLVLPWIKHHE